MKLDAATIAKLAEHLENAELERREVVKITEAHPEMDWEDAYAIQYEIRRRKQARGSRIIGLKMGLTSHAKMRQMGIRTPVFGFLADYGSVPDGGEIDMRGLIHPKVEPEVAFITKTSLRGPGCHIGAVLTATDFVVPAMEIIDSRYRDFKFDLKSVVADNCSASRFVVGGRISSVEDLDLRALGFVLEKNGRVAALGAGAAVLGHPAASVAMLANMLAERGEEIPAGCFIMTGGVTEAVSVASNDSLTLHVQSLGSVSVRFQ